MVTQIQTVQETAQYLRRFAQMTELPRYADMMHRAADDLEKHAAELRLQNQEPSSRCTS